MTTPDGETGHVPLFGPGDAPDPVYRFTRDEPTQAAVRERLEGMWAKFRPHCAEKPSQFVKELRSNFDGRAWEMHLGTALLDCGLPLRRAPRSGPDLLLDLDGRRAWIEAIVATAGKTHQNANVDWAPAGNGVEVAYPTSLHAERILRYARAINEKLAKYGTDVAKGRVQSGDPYAVAITAASIELADLDDGVPDFIKAVMGVGEARWVVRLGGQDRVAAARFPSRPAIEKKNKDLEPTDLFRRPEYAPISGVFFTSCSAINLPPNAGDAIAFFHNPWATAPFARGSFKFGVEYWVDVESEQLRREDHRGTPGPSTRPLERTA